MLPNKQVFKGGSKILWYNIRKYIVFALHETIIKKDDQLTHLRGEHEKT
jgi:hypothetical protein